MRARFQPLMNARPAEEVTAERQHSIPRGLQADLNATRRNLHETATSDDEHEFTYVAFKAGVFLVTSRCSLLITALSRWRSIVYFRRGRFRGRHRAEYLNKCEPSFDQ